MKPLITIAIITIQALFVAVNAHAQTREDQRPLDESTARFEAGLNRQCAKDRFYNYTKTVPNVTCNPEIDDAVWVGPSHIPRFDKYPDFCIQTRNKKEWATIVKEIKSETRSDKLVEQLDHLRKLMACRCVGRSGLSVKGTEWESLLAPTKLNEFLDEHVARLHSPCVQYYRAQLYCISNLRAQLNSAPRTRLSAGDVNPGEGCPVLIEEKTDVRPIEVAFPTSR